MRSQPSGRGDSPVPNAECLLTLKEAADVLRLHPRTVRDNRASPGAARKPRKQADPRRSPEDSTESPGGATGWSIGGSEPERQRVPQPHGGTLIPHPPGTNGGVHTRSRSQILKWLAVAPGAEIFYGNVELHAMMMLCDRLSPRTQRGQSPTITPCLPKRFLATQPRFAETGSRTSLCTSSSTGRSGESSLLSSVRLTRSAPRASPSDFVSTTASLNESRAS